MDSWPSRRMEELCEITSSKRIFAADYVSTGVPFYRGKEITERYKGSLRVSTALFITEEKFKEIERKFGTPKSGDLLLTSVGTLGSAYVVRPNDRFYFKDGNLTWFRNLTELDSYFLYYWLGSPQGRSELGKATIGSSQSAFTIVLLKAMMIKLPPLPTQRRIASILSAYDDLIENNTRRIQILEEMAQRIYTEWFVNFRFPGHEKVKFVNSELGKVPSEWAVKKLSDVLELNYGKALKKADRRDGNIPVYGSSGVVGHHDESIVYGPGIIVGRKGNVGSVFWCYSNFYPIDTTYYVSSDMPLRFLYYELQTKNFLNNDAAVPGLNRNQAYSLQMVKPADDILQRFCHDADLLEKQVEVLRKKNSNLRLTRDLLLPKLISGEIDVSKMPDPQEVAAA